MSDKKDKWYECPHCGEIRQRNQWGNDWILLYCPNCGAKMEGEQAMRTVRVWVDNDFIEFEVEDEYESEDELYEAVWEYVMNVITIEVV